MSSSTIIASLQYATNEIYLYGGLFILITGIMGEVFNILIFTTLKTFRKTPSGFYLTIISIANLGQIIVAVLIRTVNYGFSIDLLQTSSICKIRENLKYTYCCIVESLIIVFVKYLCSSSIDVPLFLSVIYLFAL